MYTPVHTCVCVRCTLAFINSLWLSDAIWQQGSRSTLTQVMAWLSVKCQANMNQCWLVNWTPRNKLQRNLNRNDEFHPRECILNCCLPDINHFAQALMCWLTGKLHLNMNTNFSAMEIRTCNCVMSNQTCFLPRCPISKRSDNSITFISCNFDISRGLTIGLLAAQ